MHQLKLQRKMSEGDHGHEGWMEIVLEAKGFQKIIAEPKAIFCDDIASKSIKGIAQGGNAA
jgi:hypothetical protein